MREAMLITAVFVAVLWLLGFVWGWGYVNRYAATAAKEVRSLEYTLVALSIVGIMCVVASVVVFIGTPHPHNDYLPPLFVVLNGIYILADSGWWARLLWFRSKERPKVKRAINDRKFPSIIS